MTELKGGYTGKLLRVNLSQESVSVEDLDPKLCHAYIGGRGLGSKILIEEIDPTVDPLGPDNKLLFATGPLTGTLAPCGARYMVICKSPLTGAIACSNSGGYWGPELKFAGYDILLVEGRAKKPVYLFIENDRIEIRPAEHLWGMRVMDTEDAIHREVRNEDFKIACIGPAGEKQVLVAAVMNDKHRAAGRSGVGAVLGSKNLKAVAVRGTGPVRIARGPEFNQAVMASLVKLKANPVTGQGLPSYGTPVLVNVINEHGMFPTRNFQEGMLEGADKISGETIADTILVRNKGCFACPIACGRSTKVSSPKYQGVGEGPEYETAWALGADCGVNDLEAVTKANYLCNELGMDPISVGGTLACAMELYEKGYLPEREIGRPLRFGDADALVEFTEKMGLREGFGDKLAEGSYRLARRYDHPELFMGVKKQEFAAYDPRGAQGMGLMYATSNRGACHLRGYTIAAEILGVPQQVDRFATEGKAALGKITQDATAMVDATGMCLFTTFAIGGEDILPILNAATGFEYSVDDLMMVGDRIWNLERLFNMKAGFSMEDDNLPPRLLKEPFKTGGSKGKVVELHKMLPEYYKERGWSAEGVPTKEKLAALGLRQ